jgi:hypothetical protein
MLGAQIGAINTKQGAFWSARIQSRRLEEEDR